MHRILALVSALLTGLCMCQAAPLGLHSILQPAELAFPLEGRVQMLATTAGDGEGQDYRPLKPGEKATILTVQGPAVIHRVWSTSQFTDQTRLALKLDGKEQAVWERKALPAGQQADALRAMDGQAYWSYVPVKVNEKAEFIATDLRKPAGGAAAEANKFYLQVAYSTSHDGMSTEEQIEEARARLQLVLDKPLAAASGLVVEGAAQKPQTEKITLSEKQPAKLLGDPKGYVQTLIIDPAGASLEDLAATRLIMKDSKSAKALVDVPVPYLFGAYWSLDDYASAYTAISGGKLVCRFPMPIGDGLELSLAPLAGGKGVESLAATIVRGTAAEAIPYRFCAEYRPTISQRGEPLHLAEITGEGVFVGCTFAGAAREHRKLAFLEGNEQIYVDGEEKPSWEGTGTEDYFNAAWYFSAGVQARAFHGLTHLDENPPPKMSAIRYQTADRIGFKTGLKVDMQHGSRNSVAGIDYRAVSLWYQKPPCGVKEAAPAAEPEGESGGPAGEGAQEGAPAGGLDLVTPIILGVIVLLFLLAAVRAVARARRG